MAGNQDQELAALTDEVTQVETVRDSVVTFIQGLVTIINTNKTNPEALTALTSRLTTVASSISDAVVAGTPAA